MLEMLLFFHEYQDSSARGRSKIFLLYKNLFTKISHSLKVFNKNGRVEAFMASLSADKATKQNTSRKKMTANSTYFDGIQKQ